MISGSFVAGAATRQPMMGKPAPAARHGEHQQSDTAWSTPPAGTGSGAPWAESVQPTMTGRGLVMDLGHRWGHQATPAVRRARRPYSVARSRDLPADAAARADSAAQDAAAAAHGDSTAGYYQGHQYDPQPQPFAGESYGVAPQNVRAIPGMCAKSIIHDRPGGQHLDGPAGWYAPAGFPLGEAGRWAQAHYSSPALGAMYSRNTLRGVLPQTVAQPVPQPALAGPRDSGIPGNTRHLLPRFATPVLFRSPPSASAITMASQADQAPAASPVMGIGF